jgi:hypothetical protein
MPKEVICNHCSKKIKLHSKAVMIASGNVTKKGDYYELNNIDGAFNFHYNCFIEVAGKDYYPGDDSEST